MLQACFLIAAFDCYGNAIQASAEDVILTYSAAAQVAVEFRQLQNAEGDDTPPPTAPTLTPKTPGSITVP